MPDGGGGKTPSSPSLSPTAIPQLLLPVAPTPILAPPPSPTSFPAASPPPPLPPRSPALATSASGPPTRQTPCAPSSAATASPMRTSSGRSAAPRCSSSSIPSASPAPSSSSSPPLASSPARSPPRCSSSRAASTSTSSPASSRGIIRSDDNICLGFFRIPRALMVDLENNMRLAVEALRRCGLTDAAISKLLVIQMDVLMMSPDRISTAFEDLKAIGMCIPDSRFLYCFRVMCSVKKETWLRKLALYRSCGLSEGEVIKASKMQPTLLLFADESIKKEGPVLPEDWNK